MKKYNIADIFIDICIDNEIKDLLVNNDEETIIHEFFKEFELDNDVKDTDIVWNVKFINSDYKVEGEPIYKTCNIRVYKDNKGTYTYFYNDEKSIPKVIRAKNNFNNCTFFIPTYLKEIKLLDKENVELLKICLYNMFREMFFYSACHRGYLPVHSASIIYREKAYLFSARSGVGKSTHTNLWHDYEGVDILNGDVALCKPFNNGKEAYAYSMPWCGTSGLYQNRKAKLDGIIFLARGSKNKVVEIDKRKIAIGFYMNNFSICLDEEMVDDVVSTINSLSECVKGYRLWCLPNKEAVDIIKDKITG